MKQKKYNLTPALYKSFRKFFKSIPVLEELPDRFKDTMIKQLIIEMIIENEGTFDFGDLDRNVNADLEFLKSLTTATLWIKDNIDIWYFNELYFDDYEESIINGFSFELRKDK